jgi:RNA polymerase sigma-70 factor (sigma-E family)
MPGGLDGVVHVAAAVTFAEVFAAEVDGLVRLAYLLTDSNSVAEEIVQESFIGLYRQWDTVRNPGGYVRTAVVNRAHNHLRDRKRADVGVRRMVERSERDLEVPDIGGVLLSALADLPERQRIAVVLRYWGDWPEHEIAAALGCRPGTVKSLVSRALDELRKVVPL